MSGTEAAELLGVKPATLYTYVSRGWVRRVPHPDNKQSLYFRDDIEKLRLRSQARSARGVVAASAMRFGEPIISTAITEITPEGQRYRNRSAVDLARAGCSFEAVAELLWSGILMDDPVIWEIAPPSERFVGLVNVVGTSKRVSSLHELFSIATLLLGMDRGDPNQRIREESTSVLNARQIIYAMTGCLGFVSKNRTYRPPLPNESIAQAIAGSLALAPCPGFLSLMNAALTLSADHELNSATFAARIAASSEVDIHSCIAAATCTNSGWSLARSSDQLEAFFSRASTKTQLMREMVARERTLLALPGFNHPIYPRGDPRAACLSELIKNTLPQTKQLNAIFGFLDEAATERKVYPQMFAVLAVLAVALKLPPGSAAGIYTLSRTAGWVAHVIEQRLTSFQIRPRAKYTGATRPF